jgi:hypothetical protein
LCGYYLDIIISSASRGDHTSGGETGDTTSESDKKGDAVDSNDDIADVADGSGSDVAGDRINSGVVTVYLKQGFVVDGLLEFLTSSSGEEVLLRGVEHCSHRDQGQ